MNDIPDRSRVVSFFDVDETEAQSLSDSLVHKLETKIQQFNQLKTDKLRLSVTCEETKSQQEKAQTALKASIKQLQEQQKQMSDEIKGLQEKNLKISTEKNNLQQTINVVNSQLTEQKEAAQEMAASKRKTLELLDKKNTSLNEIQLELDETREKVKTARGEIVDLETQLQQSRAENMQAKISQQQVDQELAFVKKNALWLDTELKKRTVEFDEFRTKNSTELQRAISSLNAKNSEFDILQANYDHLNLRFQEVSTKWNQNLVELKNLQVENTSNKEQFAKEMSLKSRLNDLLEKQVEDYQSKLKELEQTASSAGLSQEALQFKVESDSLREELELSEKRVKELEDTISELTSSTESSMPISGVVSSAQLYKKIALLQRELAEARHIKEHTERQAHEFLVQLEARGPEIMAQREKNVLLKKELSQLAILLEQTASEKEKLEHKLGAINSNVHNYQTQISVLTQQRLDLARQVQTLLVHFSVKHDNGGPLTSEEKEAITRLASGKDIIDESDTQKVISQRLTTFHNIVELQQRNSELLSTVRELGAKLEKEEKVSRAKLLEVENEAVKEATDVISTLQEYKVSLEKKLETVTKERDMFRNIVGHDAEQGVVSPRDQSETLRSRIRDLEHDNSVYREETEKNISLLNSEITQLMTAKTELSIAIEKEKSAKSLAEERYNMLRTSMEHVQTENQSLRARSESLQNAVISQDVRTQQTIQDLIHAKSECSSLRGEISNLHNERAVWKSVEARLNKENISLIEEKVKLSGLLTHLQSISEEREAGVLSSQKAMSSQIASLESELALAREKLEKTTTELTETLTSKDREMKNYHEKLESLRSQFSAVHEELSTRKAAAENIEVEVTLLKKQLEFAENKVKSYESINEADDSELGSQVNKLRTELERARADAVDAQAKVEELQTVASTAESSLLDVVSSFETYKKDSENTIKQLQTENSKLQDQVTVLKEDIDSLSEEAEKTRSQLNKEITSKDLQIHELGIRAASSDEIRVEYDKKVEEVRSDLRMQTMIAQNCRNDYESELQKHAETSKELTNLRSQIDDLQTASLKAQCEAQEAKAALDNSSLSWEEQKNNLESELRSLNNRVEELSSQNTLLYQQIDALSSESLSSNSAGVGEVVNLLRREKEVLETKLEMASRESSRLRSELEVISKELANAREQVSKNNTTVSNEDYDKLMEQLNQLNLLRESNITLRNQCQSHGQRVTELEKTISELEDKYSPLESEVSTLRATIVEKDAQLQLRAEDTARWKQRSQDILSKYERVDPEEYNVLKEEHAKSQETINKLKTEHQEVVSEFTKFREEYEALDAKFQKLRNEAQTKLHRSRETEKTLRNQIAESKTLLDNAVKKHAEELEKLQHSSDVSSELETVKKELADAQEKLNSSEGTIAQELEQAKKELSETKQKLESHSTDSNQLDESLKAEIAELQKQLVDARAQIESSNQNGSASNEELESLRRELELLKNADGNAQIEALQSALQQLQTEKAALEETISTREAILASKEAELVAKEKLFEKDGSLLPSLTPAPEVDVEALKKQWEQESEEKILKRIEESNEELKRKIRLPTQAKIDQIVSKKVSVLEAEFDEKVKAKATELAKEDPVTKAELEKLTSLQAEIANLKTELEAKSTQVEEVRKKAIEEGKKQAQMKITLLQKKIANLEAKNDTAQPSLAHTQAPSSPMKRAAEQDPNAEKKARN